MEYRYRTLSVGRQMVRRLYKRISERQFDLRVELLERRREQAPILIKPLDFVVRHVILNVVFKHKWIRTVGCKLPPPYSLTALAFASPSFLCGLLVRFVHSLKLEVPPRIR